MNRKYRESSSVDTLRANTLFVFLALVFGAWLSWDAAFFRLVTYAPFADYWEHTAVFNEWLQNFDGPANPHVDDPSLSARFTPIFWVLTYVGLLFGFDAIELMSLSAVLNYALIVVGLYLFLKAYFRDAWAPVFGFFAIFLCWGISWNWSNLYHLPSFFYVAGYPSSFVFGLSLISFYVVLKLLSRDGSAFILAIGVCMLSALMFISHPLTGVFGIVGCALLALTEPADGRGVRILVFLSLAAGVLLAELWPYFSVWKVALGLYGTGIENWSTDAESAGVVERLRSGVWQHIFYNPGLVITILGPALIGLPLCIWLFIRREHMFIVFGALAMAIPYLLHPFVQVPLAHRFLLFVVTYFHFAIVWGALEIADAFSSRPRPKFAGPMLGGLLGAGGVLLVANIVLLSIEFSGSTLSPKNLKVADKHGRLPDRTNVVELYSRLTEPLPEEAVVLTTPDLGWPLPTIRGKVVSLYHPNPLLIDQQQRHIATVRFFDEPQNEVQRASVVMDYEVTHMLVKGRPLTPELGGWLTEHAQLVASVGDYRMYGLRDSAAAAFQPQEQLNTAEKAEEPGAGSDSIWPEAVQGSVADQPPVEEPSIPPATEAVMDDIAPVATRPAVSAAEDVMEDAMEPASAEGEPPAGSYGAPIAEPLIPQFNDAQSEAAGVQDEISEAADEAQSLPAPAAIEPVRPAPAAAAPEAEPEPEPETFGAPIGAPVLDPQRHGGDGGE